MPGKNEGAHILPEFVCEAIPDPSLARMGIVFPPKKPSPEPDPQSPAKGDASPKEPNKAEDKTQPPDEKPAG
jgi:hypothetical protein